MGCKGGHNHACAALGLMLLGGTPDVKCDTKRATSLLSKACDDNSQDSCYALGNMYLREKGHGRPVTERDPVLAKKFLEKGCALGHGPSCFNLAVMYKRGDDGIPA